MSQMIDFTVPSTVPGRTLHAFRCVPEGEVKAVLQLSHGQVLIIQDHIVPNELPIRFFPVTNLENQKIHHRPYDRRLHAKALCMAKAATRIGPLSLK